MTNQVCDLSNKDCEPCQGGMAALDKTESEKLQTELHADWQLSADHKMISREFKFKGFARAVQRPFEAMTCQASRRLAEYSQG